MSMHGEQRPADQTIEHASGHRGEIRVYIITISTWPDCAPEVYWIDAYSEQRARARAIRYAGGGRAAQVVEANRVRMFEEADEQPE